MPEPGTKPGVCAEASGKTDVVFKPVSEAGSVCVGVKTASDPASVGASFRTGSDPASVGASFRAESDPASDGASFRTESDAASDGAPCGTVPEADMAAAGPSCIGAVVAVAAVERSPCIASRPGVPDVATPDGEAGEGASAAKGVAPLSVDAADARCPASLAADAVALSKLPAPAASEASNAASGRLAGRAVVPSRAVPCCAAPPCESVGGIAGLMAP